MPRPAHHRLRLFGHLWTLPLALALAVSAPGVADADGYNDWSSTLPEPGELWFIPALQLRASPALESYAQLQLQCGLSDRVDLIAAAAGWIGTDSRFDATLLQPRLYVHDALLLSLGLAVQGHRGGTPTSALPGVFATLRPAPRWKINLNAIGYVPLAQPARPDVFTVVVVQRNVAEGVELYAEVDTFGSLVTASAPREVVAYLGVQLDVGDDTLNLGISMPLGPSPAAQATAIGAWWAHGFTISPLRSRVAAERRRPSLPRAAWARGPR